MQTPIRLANHLVLLSIKKLNKSVSSGANHFLKTYLYQHQPNKRSFSTTIHHQSNVETFTMLTGSKLDEFNKKVLNPSQSTFTNEDLYHLVSIKCSGFSGYLKASSMLKEMKEKNSKLEEVNIDVIEEHRIKYFLEGIESQTLLLKAISQEWFNVQDLKAILIPNLTGITINGKDLLDLDEVTLLSTLHEMEQSYIVDFSSTLPARETLIVLLGKVVLKLYKSEFEEAIHLMRLFIEIYPIVMARYMTPYNGSLDESWTKVLGRVYTHDEFDWFTDLETELPIHLGGMFNIFNTFFNQINNDTTNDDNSLSVFEEESNRAPLNPYIPFFRMTIHKFEAQSVWTSLEILSKSPVQARHVPLKRVEDFGVFSNKKPNAERINDLKFTPMLLCTLALFPNIGTQTINTCFQQAEYYSRFSTSFRLLIHKMNLEYVMGNNEMVLRIFKLMEPFEKNAKINDLVKATGFACQSMRVMGMEQEIVPMLEKFVERYGNESVFRQVLDHELNLGK